MSDEKRVLELDKYEYGVIFHSLNDKRSQLLADNQPTDAVDDMILKLMESPVTGKKKERRRYAAR